MTNSDKRLRMLFEIDGKYKSFYWFECNNEDLYWGPSNKVSIMYSGPFSGPKTKIDLSNCSVEQFTAAKSSYHKSGRYHVTLQNNDDLKKYESVMQWRGKSEINEPFRIMALFTKPLELYDNYDRSPTSKGCDAAIIKMLASPKKRYYVEFFISPEGDFPSPKPLIEVFSNVQDQPVITHSLSSKYILMVRMLNLPLDHAFHSWHPDKELCFVTEDKKTI